MSHTPGPWEVHIGLDYFAIYNSAGNTVVPESRCNPESERDVADARLIAAAPELLEALTRLVAFESQDEDFIAQLAEDSAAREENPSTSIWRERLIQDAEAAISKATGGTQ